MALLIPSTTSLSIRYFLKPKCLWPHAIYPCPDHSKFSKTFLFHRIRHRRRRNDSVESRSRHGFRGPSFVTGSFDSAATFNKQLYLAIFRWSASVMPHRRRSFSPFSFKLLALCQPQLDNFALGSQARRRDSLSSPLKSCFGTLCFGTLLMTPLRS